MVFYLKVNQKENWSMKCLQHWVDTIETMPGSNRIFVLCDKEDVKGTVQEEICFGKVQISFLQSERSAPELKHVVSSVTKKSWGNAAYAHLTTFYHARENGFKYFWNIDADDTFICLSPARAGELLQTAEQYAQENAVDIFSLDMWRTWMKGEHWSFGITFTSNQVDWFEEMRKNCIAAMTRGKHSVMGLKGNLDEYFSTLKKFSTLRIETFYFENLSFIHYSNDMFTSLRGAGFYHWKENRLTYPILLYCVGMEEEALLPIADDVVKLEIDIQDEECRASLVRTASDGVVWWNELRTSLCELPQNSKIMIYGVRGAATFLVDEVKRLGLELVCIVDRNFETISMDGVEILPIDTALLTREYDYIVLGCEIRKTCCELREILLDKGVSADRILSLFFPKTVQAATEL